MEAAARLKQETEGDLVVMGSGMLIPALMEHHLVDEFLLTVSPVILGSGHRMFPETGVFAPLQLVDSRISTTGVVIATYRPTELKGETPFAVEFEKSLPQK